MQKDVAIGKRHGDCWERGAGGARSEDFRALEELQSSGKDLAGTRSGVVHQNGHWTSVRRDGNTGSTHGSWIGLELQRDVARLHFAKLAYFRREVTGDTHGHGADATRVAAQINDDAVGGTERVHGDVKRSRDGNQPDVEANQADFMVCGTPALPFGFIKVTPGEFSWECGKRSKLGVRT